MRADCVYLPHFQSSLCNRDNRHSLMLYESVLQSHRGSVREWMNEWVSETERERENHLKPSILSIVFLTRKFRFKYVFSIHESLKEFISEIQLQLKIVGTVRFVSLDEYLVEILKNQRLFFRDSNPRKYRRKLSFLSQINSVTKRIMQKNKRASRSIPFKFHKRTKKKKEMQRGRKISPKVNVSAASPRETSLTQ